MFGLQLEDVNGNIINVNDGINYQTIACSGLNPPSASIFRSTSPNRKGSKYNGSTLNERYIVLTVVLMGEIEQNRNNLYQWADSEGYIKVRYQNGLKSVFCEGHVESCEVDLFTQLETMHIAIVCENPYWQDLQAISVDISMLLAQMSFPVGIEEPGMPFSTMRDTNTTAVVNTGTETGCVIELHLSGGCSDITIFNARDTTEQMVINGTYTDGEIIVIDSENSPKSVTLIETDGSISNILRNVEPGATWFKVRHGINEYSYVAETGEQNITMILRFTNKYLGV